MAVQGLWNLGSVNLPDFGVTEWLNKNVGTNFANNAGLVKPAFAAESPADIPPTGTTGSTPVSSSGYQLTQNPTGTNLVQSTSPTQQTNTQPVNTNPQPTQNTQNPDDLWQQVFSTQYVGWNDQQSAYNDWVSKGRPLPQANNGTPSGPTVAELEAQLAKDVNNAYAGTEEALNKQEQLLRSQQPGEMASIAGAFDLRNAQAESDLASGKSGLDVVEKKNWDQKQDVLAASRQLYNELRMGANQRFGGASSAGEAVNTLLAREQQKQFGQTQRTFMDNFMNIQQSRAEMDRQYKLNLQQLNLARDEANRKATDDFKNRLFAIDKDRLLTQDAKARANLEALQDLRASAQQAQSETQSWIDKLNYQKEVMDMEFAYDVQLLAEQNKYKTPSGHGSNLSLKEVNGVWGNYDNRTGSFTPLQGQIKKDDDYIDFGA